MNPRHRNLSEPIRVLRQSGKSYKEIADELKCSLSTVSYYCGTGQKKKVRERTRSRKSRKLAYVQEYKQGRECKDCREKYPYWILEFDHLGDKIANVSKMCNSPAYTLENVKAEITKCDVVCANCHKNRTWTRLVETYGSTMDVTEFYMEDEPLG